MADIVERKVLTISYVVYSTYRNHKSIVVLAKIVVFNFAKVLRGLDQLS